MPETIRIGVAGWSIPPQHQAAFAGEGTHLARYARRFNAVEINSSFYRPHRPATYARWAASVPPDFRFAVKLPREITHRRKLVDAAEPLDRFLGEIATLGETLGPVLVQLPPSLAYNDATAIGFFDALRRRFDGQVVCEPRHPSWFSDAVDAALARLRIARVAADPAPVPRAAAPGGWLDLVYYRLHGSPKMYYSAYAPTQLDVLAFALAKAAGQGCAAWCIFDNTARGDATANAMSVMDAMSLAARGVERIEPS